MIISGNTFIVTGGCGGIGGGVARMLLEQGGSVGLFDVVADEVGQKIASEMSSTGQALYVRVNIADDEAVRAAVAAVASKYGNLKGCVHCAGIALKRDWTNDVAESIPNFKKVSH